VALGDLGLLWLHIVVAFVVEITRCYVFEVDGSGWESVIGGEVQ